MSSKERWIVAVGGLSVLASLVASMQPGLDFGDTWIRNTARIAVVWYALAVVGMIYLQPRHWFIDFESSNCLVPSNEAGRIVRWAWTWGAVVFLIHVVVAFHFFHRWSHAKAYAHVAEAGGFGEGVFVSYFFTILWAFDAAWWWINAKSYATRPNWLGRSIHLFMLFIVINGTIVFEKGIIRWIAGLMLACFAVASVQRLVNRKNYCRE